MKQVHFLPKKDFYLSLPHQTTPALDLQGELISGEHSLRNRVEEITEQGDMQRVQTELTAKKNQSLI